MDAPLWEIIIRFITVGAAAFAAWAVFVLLHVQMRERTPIRHLTGFMSLVLSVTLIYRIYVLWIGLQHDPNDHYETHIAPLVRGVGAGLLALILLGAGMVAVFYMSHRHEDTR